MDTTVDKPKHNVQLICWISSEVDDWIKRTLKTLEKHGIKTSKSELVRRAISDKLFSLEEIFIRFQLELGGEKANE